MLIAPSLASKKSQSDGRMVQLDHLVSFFVRRHPVSFLAGYLAIVIVACLWPFNFFQANLIGWDSSGGLRFTPPAIAYMAGDVSAIKAVRKFSLLVHCSSPEKGMSGRQGTILGYSINAERRNFAFEERVGGVIFRVYSRGRRWPLEVRFPDDRKSPERWIVVRYDGKILGGLINGKRIRDVNAGRLDFSGWDPSYPLVIGNEGDGKSPWNGDVDTIALLDSAWSFESLQHPAALIDRSSPLLLLVFEGARESASADRSRLQPLSVTIPDRFKPARRVILEKPRLSISDLPDILINIIGFVPLGFFTTLAFRPASPRDRWGLPVAMIAGLVVSTAMELLQAYLPTRSSSMNDVLSNTAGMIPGYYLAKWTSTLLERRAVKAMKLSTVP